MQKKGKSNSDFCYKESHIKPKTRTAKMVLSVSNGKLTKRKNNLRVVNRKNRKKNIVLKKRRLKIEKKSFKESITGW